MEECFSSCIAQPVGICIFSFGRYWWISFRRSRVIFIIIRCICDEISLDSILFMEYKLPVIRHSQEFFPSSEGRPRLILVRCCTMMGTGFPVSVGGKHDLQTQSKVQVIPLWGEVRMSRWELYTPIQSHLSNYNTLELIILNTLAVQIQESGYSILSLFLVNLISCSILSLMELSCPLTVEWQPHCSTCACRDVYFDQVYSKTHKVKEA